MLSVTPEIQKAGNFWILASWTNESMFFFFSLLLGKEQRDLVIDAMLGIMQCFNPSSPTFKRFPKRA